MGMVYGIAGFALLLGMSLALLTASAAGDLWIAVSLVPLAIILASLTFAAALWIASGQVVDRQRDDRIRSPDSAEPHPAH